MSFDANLAHILVGGAMWFFFQFADPAEPDSPVLSFLTRPWTMPTLLESAMMGIIGVIAAIGFSIGTQAYRLGEANRLAPMEYTTLIWATILSAAGIFVLRREHSVQRKPFSKRGIFRYR